MISDFCAVLRVISTILCSRPIQQPMFLSLRGSRASYRNIRCRSNKLTKKNPRRLEPALGRHEANSYEPPRVRVDLHLATWPGWVGGNSLAVSKPGHLVRGEPSRRPALERRVGGQQQLVESGQAARGRGLQLG